MPSCCRPAAVSVSLPAAACCSSTAVSRTLRVTSCYQSRYRSLTPRRTVRMQLNADVEFSFLATRRVAAWRPTAAIMPPNVYLGRLRWRWRIRNRRFIEKSSPKNKTILRILWRIRKFQCTRRKVDTLYRISPAGSPRVLSCWNSHVCLWILQINISLERFVWFFSRCPLLYPSSFLYHFWCILKNWKKW